MKPIEKYDKARELMEEIDSIERLEKAKGKMDTWRDHDIDIDECFDSIKKLHNEDNSGD